ncbi:MAG: SspB family protein [Dichotomicrobium sp.]
MSDDAFRYDILAQEALRGVVRSVLRSVEKRGLPGDHHFVITFDTSAPGVSLSKRLLDRYPQDMTIVIQYQFWGLKVYENAFEIGLSFNNVPETLVIPFRAMTSFQDPSVGFMLQFAGPDLPGETGMAERGAAVPIPGEDVPAPASSKLPSPAEPALPGPGETAVLGARPAEEAGETESAPGADSDGGEDWQDNDSDEKKKGAEVVHLDAFRKK